MGQLTGQLTLSGLQLVSESMFLVACHSVLQYVNTQTSRICEYSVYLLIEELLRRTSTSVDPGTTPW